MCNFHPLEVVGRGSETQLQVGENSIQFRATRFNKSRVMEMWYFLLTRGS